MNHIERFKAVCAGEKPDYFPIFGFPGAPGMSGGCMATTHQRLVATGMPEWVDGCSRLGKPATRDGWRRYWGTTGPVRADFYWGSGPEAGDLAGRMRQQGRLWLLWPRGAPPPRP